MEERGGGCGGGGGGGGGRVGGRCGVEAGRGRRGGGGLEVHEWEGEGGEVRQLGGRAHSQLRWRCVLGVVVGEARGELGENVVG